MIYFNIIILNYITNTIIKFLVTNKVMKITRVEVFTYLMNVMQNANQEQEIFHFTLFQNLEQSTNVCTYPISILISLIKYITISRKTSGNSYSIVSKPIIGHLHYFFNLENNVTNIINR